MSEDSNSEPKQTSSNSSWDSLENIVSIVGKYAWILLVIQKFIQFLGVILSFSLGGLIWFLVSFAIVGAAVWFFLLPFAKRCGEKDWHGIKNNVFILGDLRIPKMLAISIGLVIFTNGWGGLLILIAVVLILFIEPEPVQWKLTQAPAATEE